MTDVIAIDARDNVATALRALTPGEPVVVAGATVAVREPIPAGHKVALVGIAAGAPVVKYGSSIGLALAPIAAGAHVHTHNVASTRGRGDLAPAAPPRLAEPHGDAAAPADPEDPAS